MAVVSYKCPYCGGELEFDPVSQKYKCPYCLAVLDELPEDAAKETEEKKETKEVKETNGSVLTDLKDFKIICLFFLSTLKYST